MKCSVDSCEKESLKKGLCNAHYLRMRRHGSPTGGGTSHISRAGRKCLVEGCEKPLLSQYYCGGHHNRLKSTGSLELGKAQHGQPVKYLFELSTIEYQEECITWPFSKNNDGYGKLQYGSKMRVASRVLCEIVYGDAPTEMHQAAHNCGNGHLACVNPHHLRWATPKENCLDIAIHKRIRNEAA